MSSQRYILFSRKKYRETQYKQGKVIASSDVLYLHFFGFLFLGISLALHTRAYSAHSQIAIGIGRRRASSLLAPSVLYVYSYRFWLLYSIGFMHEVCFEPLFVFQDDSPSAEKWRWRCRCSANKS